MRAGLPKSEPVTLKKWEDNKVYDKLMEHNEGKPLYVLHDGPPYANGDIHLGHALNKILKDFIVRYKNMSGFKSPYVPGWDTHGLPTELKARQKAGIGSSADISVLELRKMCEEFVTGYINDQRNQFKRLGAIGEWDNPYITLKHEFEAEQIKVFAEMATKGYIYKGLKPVYWCPECKTALAEAEIEYAEDPCHSIYVKFKVTDDLGKFAAMGIDPQKVNFVIWTTTTWTLPANLAICVGPRYEYSIIKSGDEYYIIATELYKAVLEEAEITDYEVVGSIKGSELEYMKTAHPFLDRESLIIVGEHVTLESGTGCVHTAPGHGVDDYNVCQNYPEIPVLCPVDSNGVLTEEAGQFAGLTTDEANKKIAIYLDETGSLFALKKIIHQYPHCWRCKSPILFRATDQWFCSVDDFKDKAIDAINTVEWVPAWGKERITSMVRDRKDWCISRQRKWGVPIPIFYCKDCNEPYVDKEAMLKVAEIFSEEGSNAWFEKEAKDLMPDGVKCPKCGCSEFEKEKDIMDVWFDSGSSHTAVVKRRPYLKFPADLYLEGNDQYRGWFQSSLLTSVATDGVAPYKTVLTHGMILDMEKRKMSKSLGNGISPQEVINQYGADVLRLWVSSSDYQSDVSISREILKQTSEAYRKIRNTARYILGNLSDFDPDKDMVEADKLSNIDKWAVKTLNNLIEKVEASYEKFEFHQVYHSIHNFCVVDMSNFYLDVLKDTLYTEKKDSPLRRSAQTAIYHILDAMTRMLCPILAYTSDEIWQYMPHKSTDNTESIIFNDMPKTIALDVDDDFMSQWERISELRDSVKKEIEVLVKDKTIKSSLESKVTLTACGEYLDFLRNVESEIKPALIVSEVEILEGEGELKISVEKAEGEKCERCWVISKSVGLNSTHPTLCDKCCKFFE
jgi:isoleucyl-tRNA synthetase